MTAVPSSAVCTFKHTRSIHLSFRTLNDNIAVFNEIRRHN